MIGKNEVENYMYMEWLEAREYVTAKKRQKQRNCVSEYLGAKTFRVSTEAGDSHSNEPKEKIREAEEEVT